MRLLRTMLLILVLLLVQVPVTLGAGRTPLDRPIAAVPNQYNGSDLWVTSTDGFTYPQDYLGNSGATFGFSATAMAFNQARGRLCSADSGGTGYSIDPLNPSGFAMYSIGFPVSTIVPVGNQCWFFASAGDRVTLIDVATNVVVRTITIGLNASPDTGYAVDGSTVYVSVKSRSADHTAWDMRVVGIDRTQYTTTSYLFGRASDPGIGMASSSTNNLVYAEFNGTLYQFDANRKAFSPLSITVPTTGFVANGLWFDTAGQLWVAKHDATQTTVSAINLTDQTIARTTTFDGAYTNLAYDARQNRLWLVSPSSVLLATSNGPVDFEAPRGSISLPELTTSRTVTVTLNASDNIRVTEMQVATTTSFAGVAWQPYLTTAQVQLSPGDGQKTVYARFRDAAGNQSPAVSAITTLREIQTTQEQEPNDTLVAATPVAIPASGQADLTGLLTTNDTDFFAATTATDGAWVVQTTAPGVSLTLLSGDGTPFARGNPSNGGTRLGAPLSAGITYFLYVEGPPGTAYTLNTRLITNDTDKPTLTVTSPQAQTIVNGTVHPEATAQDPTTPTWKLVWLVDGNSLATVLAPPYQFDWDTKTQPNGTHTLSAVAYDAAGNSTRIDVPVRVDNALPDTQPPTLTVQAPNRTAVTTVSLQLTAQDNTPGPLEVMVSTDATFSGAQWQPLTPTLAVTVAKPDGVKTIYVKARDSAGNASAVSTVTTVLDTQHEPNDTLAQAAPLPPGASVTGRIGTADDMDLYQLKTTTAGWLYTAISGSSAELGVLSSTSQVLCTNNPCSIKVEANSTYYLRLTGAPHPDADYILSTTFTPASQDAADTQDQAANLPIPGSANDAINGDGDVDFFRFTATVTGQVSIRVETADASLLRLVVLDEHGNEVAPASGNRYPVRQGKTYYVRVSAPSRTVPLPYQIITAQVDLPKPGTSLSEALPLTLGDQQVSLPPDANDVFYRLTPTTAGMLTVSLDSGATQDLDLQILDATGNEVAASRAGYGQPDWAEYPVGAGQTYYLAVHYYAGRRVPSTLSARILDPAAAPDPYETNDTLSSATNLVIGTEIAARIDSPTDLDTFRIYAPQAGTLTVNLASIVTNADLDLRVYTQGGSLVATSTAGIGLPDQVILPLSQGEALYVQVLWYSGRTPAPYTLRTSFQPGSTGQDAGEPNDTMATSTALSATTQATISSPGDVDYYRFVASTAGPITFRLTVSVKSDLDLYLLDAAGNVITSSRKGLGLTEDCTLQASAGATYYVRIVYYSGQTPAAYTLTMSP